MTELFGVGIIDKLMTGGMTSILIAFLFVAYKLGDKALNIWQQKKAKINGKTQIKPVMNPSNNGKGDDHTMVLILQEKIKTEEKFEKRITESENKIMGAVNRIHIRLDEYVSTESKKSGN